MEKQLSTKIWSPHVLQAFGVILVVICKVCFYYGFTRGFLSDFTENTWWVGRSISGRMFFLLVGQLLTEFTQGPGSRKRSFTAIKCRQTSLQLYGK